MKNYLLGILSALLFVAFVATYDSHIEIDKSYHLIIIDKGEELCQKNDGLHTYNEFGDYTCINGAKFENKT